MKRISYHLIFILALFLCASPSLVAQKKSTKNNVHQVSISTYNGVPDIGSGFWTAVTEDGEVQLQLMNKNRKKHTSFIIGFSAAPGDIQSQNGNSMIVRDAGTLTLEGGYNGAEGTGSFTFVRNGSFESFLENQGISARGEDDYYFLKMFLCDVNQNYVRQIKSYNYDPTLNELAKLGIHDVSIDFIDFLQGTHYKNVALTMIAKFAIHGVSENYLRGLEQAGYGTMDANMVKKFAVHGISLRYLEGLKAQGYGDMEPNMVKNFAVHGISVSYLQALKDAGYGNLEPSMVKKFAVHGINGKYIQNLLGADINRPTAREIQKAKIHGVSAKFIDRAKRAGHESRELTDYTKWKIRGI